MKKESSSAKDSQQSSSTPKTISFVGAGIGVVLCLGMIYYNIDNVSNKWLGLLFTFLKVGALFWMIHICYRLLVTLDLKSARMEEMQKKIDLIFELFQEDPIKNKKYKDRLAQMEIKDDDECKETRPKQ